MDAIEGLKAEWRELKMIYTIGDKIGDDSGCGTVFECVSEVGDKYAIKFLNEPAPQNTIHRFQK